MRYEQEGTDADVSGSPAGKIWLDYLADEDDHDIEAVRARMEEARKNQAPWEADRLALRRQYNERSEAKKKARIKALLDMGGTLAGTF